MWPADLTFALRFIWLIQVFLDGGTRYAVTTVSKFSLSCFKETKFGGNKVKNDSKWFLGTFSLTAPTSRKLLLKVVVVPQGLRQTRVIYCRNSLLHFSSTAANISGHINIYDIHLLDNISECQMTEGGD